ncbi:HAD family hydrolase [Haladaptatus cibarius]|uniref:HAD family hydrolase n=1 Tax=Haladaptatus cibarius TaxID=453847 RepID=UPI000678EB26|nr:HAD family hydrolase [Haladaptatus cibarius]
MDIDTVLFDLDDTLLEYEQDSRDVLSSSFDRVGVEPFFDIPAYHARYDEFLERGKSVDEQRSNCFAAIARDTEYDPNVGRTVAEAFAEIRDQSRVRYLPGASATLEALARAKPHPEPFESVLAELDSTADRAVHVGNSLTTDIPGAKAAGLGAV